MHTPCYKQEQSTRPLASIQPTILQSTKRIPLEDDEFFHSTQRQTSKKLKKIQPRHYTLSIRPDGLVISNYLLVVSRLFFRQVSSLLNWTRRRVGKQKQLFPPEPILAKLSLCQLTCQGCKWERTNLSVSNRTPYMEIR